MLLRRQKTSLDGELTEALALGLAGLGMGHAVLPTLHGTGRTHHTTPASSVNARTDGHPVFESFPPMRYRFCWRSMTGSSGSLGVVLAHHCLFRPGRERLPCLPPGRPELGDRLERLVGPRVTGGHYPSYADARRPGRVRRLGPRPAARFPRLGMPKKVRGKDLSAVKTWPAGKPGRHQIPALKYRMISRTGSAAARRTAQSRKAAIARGLTSRRAALSLHCRRSTREARGNG